MKATIAIIVALLLAMVANAGPFGYEMGQKIEGEPDGVAYDSGNSYRTMPNPPAPFEEVVAFYTKEAGVCSVAANMDVPLFIDDDSGAEHRRMADGLAHQIKAKYGQPTEFVDELIDGSIFRSPHRWLETISTGERDYYYTWKLPSKPDNIFAIQVIVEYHNIRLLYHFANYKQCQDRLQEVL